MFNLFNYDITFCLNSWSNTSSVSLKKFDTLFYRINKTYPINKNMTQLINYHKVIMIFKATHGICLTYISDKFQLVKMQHSYNTRVSTSNNLITTRALNKYAKKTFLKSSSSVWNDLPIYLKTINSLLIFKSNAKNHFFIKYS